MIPPAGVRLNGQGIALYPYAWKCISGITDATALLNGRRLYY